MPLIPGFRLGPYEILSLLGAGGMGEVYQARDSKLDRFVAVKVLPESVAADPGRLGRFEREASRSRAVSSEHPAIHDFGTHEGTLRGHGASEGGTLRGKLTWAHSPKQAVDYALQIARVSAAHERISHRDLKPENLFVGRRPSQILDFGLASARRRLAGRGDGRDRPGHTKPGQSGQIGYMSPGKAGARRTAAPTSSPSALSFTRC